MNKFQQRKVFTKPPLPYFSGKQLCKTFAAVSKV